jgi:hypothetical protein
LFGTRDLHKGGFPLYPFGEFVRGPNVSEAQNFLPPIKVKWRTKFVLESKLVLTKSYVSGAGASVGERRGNSIRVGSPFADFKMSGSDCDGSLCRIRERVSNCWVALIFYFLFFTFFFLEN